MRLKVTAAARQGLWRDRATLLVIGAVLWSAVYWRVADLNGQGSGIVAATCAAWGYVLVSTVATHLLNQRSSGGQNGRKGPPNRSGNWPGASP